MKGFERLVFLLLPLLLVACGGDDDASKQEIAKPVKAITIAEQVTELNRTFSGKVIASEEVEIAFQVSGKLIEFPAVKGQDFKKGDLLARLEPKDYELVVDDAKARLTEAKSSYERFQELLKKNFASKAEFDRIKSSYETAIANLEIAKQNLSYTYLYAPFDGRVADTFTDNYEFVTAKEKVLLYQNINILEVVIDVPENLMMNVKKTDALVINASFAAAPQKKYQMAYSRHKSDADVATQSYKVYLTLPKPEDLTILPGMTAAVNIVLRKKENGLNKVFLIPASSIFSDEDGNSYVWKINSENRLEKATIGTGSLAENSIEVTQGINVGDTIVVSGVNFLNDNQLVKIWEP